MRSSSYSSLPMPSASGRIPATGTTGFSSLRDGICRRTGVRKADYTDKWIPWASESRQFFSELVINSQRTHWTGPIFRLISGGRHASSYVCRAFQKNSSSELPQLWHRSLLAIKNWAQSQKAQRLCRHSASPADHSKLDTHISEPVFRREVCRVV